MERNFDFIDKAFELKASHALFIDVSQVKFDERFRGQCEQNACGFYNKNWMCPPAVGEIGDLIKKVSDYEKGLLFQTVHPLEDSFDWEGMMEGQAEHEKVFRALIAFTEGFGEDGILPLGAGPCLYCKKCAYLSEKPCFFPDKRVSSVEAYGIDVMGLLKNYGVPYVNGQNTVSYVGLILFKKGLV